MNKISIIEIFKDIPDPRKEGHGKKKHELLDIIIITILACICGADTWVDVEEYGNNKEVWLKTILTLSHGIPSHDTLSRVFSILDPQAFQNCFFMWMENIKKETSHEVVAIDGKCVRHSFKKGGSPFHMVSAYATSQGLTLAQVQISDKSNEIVAIPSLLDLLTLQGCIVTIDAMGCQETIAKKIRERKGHYMLAVKGNQGNLLDDVSALYTEEKKKEALYYSTSEQAHGRIEVRECFVQKVHTQIRNSTRWKDIHSVVSIIDTRTEHGKKQSATRYFITSLDTTAEEALRVVRAHWSIENTLHWTLDIAFREDESRMRIGNSTQNFALIRKLAGNLLRHEKTAQGGIKAKRLQAGWNDEYLIKVLQSLDTSGERF